MALYDMTCEEFAEVLASKTSVPGGGGAASLCGALGIALGSMVGNYTVGKKNYKDVEEEVIKLNKKANELQKRFIELIEEDAKAFEPLSQAYSISKDDPMRADLFEAATITAATPPFEMVKACGEAIELLREYANKGSKLLISDAGCGAALCKAAMQAAAMNVFINTKSLIDRKTANDMEEEVDFILNKYIPIGDEIIEEVTRRIRG